MKSYHPLIAWMLLTALYLLPTAASAQQTDSTLSLKQALQFALNNKAEVRKARLSEENADYQIEEVRSRALPQISGTGSLTYNPLLQMVALPGELAGQPGKSLLVAFGQKWNANTAISLSQNIFDKSVFTGLKAAKTTREYYQILSGATDEQIIEQVASNYYQVMVQQQKLAVIDSNIANSQRIFQIIDGLFENGLAKKN